MCRAGCCCLVNSYALWILPKCNGLHQWQLNARSRSGAWHSNLRLPALRSCRSGGIAPWSSLAGTTLHYENKGENGGDAIAWLIIFINLDDVSDILWLFVKVLNKKDYRYCGPDVKHLNLNTFSGASLHFSGDPNLLSLCISPVCIYPFKVGMYLHSNAVQCSSYVINVNVWSY